jgi:site-specific DNA recombinase
VQRQDIERYALREGIEIVEWFEEPGISAFRDTDKRTEFARMVRQAKADSSISLILVWKSDRFSRNRHQAAAAKGELERAGVQVLSVTEPYDTRTTSGIVLESVTDAMNQIRAMEIGQVTHRALLANCELRDPSTNWAYKNGGMAPFGYRKQRVFLDAGRKYQRISHCIWVLDDDIIAGKLVHEWVRTMLVEWRLKEQLGPDIIARRLTEEGVVPTPRGRMAWCDSTINYLLTSEMLLQYAGYGIWNRHDRKKSGKHVKNPNEWKITENAHPAIITLEEAKAINAVRAKRKPGPKKVKQTRVSPFVLSGGLLTCKRCSVNLAGRNKNGVDYYVCGSEIYRHGADCGRPAWYIRREDLECATFDCIQTLLASDSKHTRLVVEKYNKWVDSQIALYEQTEAERKDEIERLKQEIENLTKSLAEGVHAATVRAAINERAEYLNKLESLHTVELPKKITARDTQALALQVREVAESRDADRRRAAVRRYVAAMQADPEKRTVRVIMHSLNSICGHSTNNSMVPPRGFAGIAQGMTTFEIRFKSKHRYSIRVV